MSEEKPPEGGTAGAEPEGTQALRDSEVPATPPATLLEPRERLHAGGGDDRPTSAAESLDELDLVPGTRIGRYVLLHRVGRGGMGVVWAGYDPELDRKVAVKLLRFDRAGAERSRLRLLREAQGTARLAHPNVVAVHDVGTFGGQVFMAMEYVVGPEGVPFSLGAWLDKAPRSWREILDRFAAAGRGLAAAHAAGLVHRDFKPDNVLIGADDRVRVVDFGLVRPTTGPEADADDEEGGETTEPAVPSPPTGPLVTPLTEPGKVMGTPAYMAPEQLRGGKTDARSDQFSFCVALYEALYGERPFPGKGIQAVEAALAGNVESAPRGSRVPAWLRQTLLRGLAAEPADRWGSMEDLLAALGRDPTTKRRRWLAAAALVLLVAAGALAFARVQRRQELLCGAEARLAGVWDAERRDRVRAAFLATRAPFAEDAWRGVAEVLDRYTSDWSGMYPDACEATLLRGEQVETPRDRRMGCLDESLDEVRSLTDLFAVADVETITHARSAVGALAPVAECADPHALRERVLPPRDLEQRADVAALQSKLAAAKALGDVGKPREAVAAARFLQAPTKNVGFAPLEAEVSYVLGLLLAEGEPEEAVKLLRRAYSLADRGTDDVLRARAASACMWVFGRVLQRSEDAGEWRELAEAAVSRLPTIPALRSQFLGRLGGVQEAEGHYKEALESQEDSLKLLRSLLTAEDPAIAEAFGGVGSAHYRLGEYEAAEQAFVKALDIQRKTLGAEHPDSARTLSRLGSVALAQGKLELAVARQRRALSIRERVFGPDHPLVADTLNDLGSALDELARYDEALASHTRALAIRRRVFGTHSSVASSLDNIGAVHANRREFDRAFEYHRQALDVRLETQGHEHPRTATTLHNLGNARTLQGRYKEALPWLEQALAVEEKALGPDHPYVAEELTAIADIQRRLGNVAAAPPLLERALRIVEAQELDPGNVARTRFALAQALWDAGGDRKRAVELARQARADFAPLPGEGDKMALAEVEQWLSKHSGARGTRG